MIAIKLRLGMRASEFRRGISITKQGLETGKFGGWLTEYMQSLPRYQVYFDHGDKSRYSNVLATKGFYSKCGDVVTNANRLTDLDIVVIEPTGSAALVIEIEERPCSPKKILGDILALMLCNRLAARVDGEQKYYELSQNTKIIVAGVLPGNGCRLARIHDLIEPRLRNLNAPPDSINPTNIHFIFNEHIKDVINELKKVVQEMFPKVALK